MHEIFGRTTCYMQMWAADPRHCGVKRRNVLGQVALFLDALDDHGRRDVAHAALDLLAAPLGLAVVEKDATATSDKGCPDLELDDLAVAIDELQGGTGACWFVYDGESTVPIPKSLVKELRMLPNRLDCIMRIPEWLARERGILP